MIRILFRIIFNVFVYPVLGLLMFLSISIMLCSFLGVSDIAGSDAVPQFKKWLMPLQTYRDEFNARTYAETNGTVDWSTSPWVEIAEPTGPGPINGPVQVSPNTTYCLSPNCLRVGGTQPLNPDPGFGIYRQLDLSGSSSATLTYSYRRGTFGSPVPTAGTLTLDMSANGGGSWTTITTYNFDGTDPGQTSESFDISAYIASNSQIRFLTHGPVDDIVFFIDNIQIEYQPFVPEICDNSIDDDGDGQVDCADTECCCAQSPVLTKN